LNIEAILSIKIEVGCCFSGLQRVGALLNDRVASRSKVLTFASYHRHSCSSLFFDIGEAVPRLLAANHLGKMRWLPRSIRRSSVHVWAAPGLGEVVESAAGFYGCIRSIRRLASYDGYAAQGGFRADNCLTGDCGEWKLKLANAGCVPSVLQADLAAKVREIRFAES
jgi:hypothetical protein